MENVPSQTSLGQTFNVSNVKNQSRQPTAIEAAKSAMNDSQRMAAKRAQARQQQEEEEAAEAQAAKMALTKVSDIAKQHSNKKPSQANLPPRTGAAATAVKNKYDEDEDYEGGFE